MAATIRVDRPTFSHSVQQFLTTSLGKKALAEFGLPTWVLIGVGFFQVVMGGLLLLTIIKIPFGLKNIFEGLTFKALRDQSQGSPATLAKLKPVIGHLVYGNTSTGLGVVLASLSNDANETTMCAIAQQCTALYGQATPEASRAVMWRILKDDTYHPYRRRALVAPFNVDSEAFLFDVHLNFNDGSPTPWKTMMYAFVLLVDSDGGIAQVPWSVAKSSVSIG